MVKENESIGNNDAVGCEKTFEVVDSKVIKNTSDMLKEIVNLDTFAVISEKITKTMLANLSSEEFFNNLQLNEGQQKELQKMTSSAVSKAKEDYLNNLKADIRTKKVIEIVENRTKQIIEEVLAGIAENINRGAIINAVAVSADTKNKDVNKIELNYSKKAGCITIPTKGGFISDNCIASVLDAVEVLKDDKLATELYYKNKFHANLKEESETKEEKTKVKK